MSTATTSAAVAVGRVHYVVEYSDRSGRRRQQRKSTLNAADRFSRRLRMGSNAIIRLVTRKAKA